MAGTTGPAANGATDEPNDFGHRGGGSLVTGGSGGIGRAVCRLLAQRGSPVAFTYRHNRAAADELVAELGSLGVKAVAHQLDLVDAAETAAVVDATIDELDGIHTVVHAAGPTVDQQHLSAITPERYDEQLRAEVSAFFNVVSASLTELRSHQGSLIAVTTAATRRHPVRDGLSATTKASIEAIIRGVAAEEGRFGVRANCVGPGMLTDGMAQRLMASGDLDERALEVTRANIPLRRFGTAVDIAEAVCFLASDRAGFITGQKLDVDGGYTV